MESKDITNTPGIDIKREFRSARFEVINEEEGINNNSDYICLDIPTDLLEYVYYKVKNCIDIENKLRAKGIPSAPDNKWVIGLCVKPHHQYLKGSVDENGNDIYWPPSLLNDDIPRDILNYLEEDK